ncbi:MAG: glycosyltransferase family 2 protein [Promethearchaeota archaeon]
MSICIPTYNRDTILYDLLNKIIKFKSEEIEIVISDNASVDNTKELVESIKDDRIKYFRNDKNLGFDGNILKLVERANGEFLFFCGDDENPDIEAFPYILNIIKKQKNLSTIVGSVGDKRSHKNKIPIMFNDRIYKGGAESLIELGFNIHFLTGLVIKKEPLNINQAKEFIGCTYMQQVLMTQAMMAGDTLCSSKIFWNYWDNSVSTTIRMIKPYCNGQSYYHPLSRLSQLEDRIFIINKMLSHLPKVQKILLNRVKSEIGERLVIIIINNPKIFLSKIFIFINIISRMNVLFSLEFWKAFIKNSFNFFLTRYIWRKNNIN